MPRVGTLAQPSSNEGSENFRVQIQLFREKYNFTQKALGKKLGYSQRTVSDVETGNRNPSAEFIKAFEDFKQTMH
jgi:transcriptional regulator with XRE-family HTH domain